MPSTTVTIGELLYDITVQLTQVTEYGVSFEALMAGQMSPRPEGARFDTAFEGISCGPKLKGTISGSDYIHIRADGRAQLHFHAEFTTVEGEKIAVFGEGVFTPEGQVRHNVTLTTASPAYSWVNHLQVWDIGTYDAAKNEVSFKGYAA